VSQYIVCTVHDDYAWHFRFSWSLCILAVDDVFVYPHKQDDSVYHLHRHEDSVYPYRQDVLCIFTDKMTLCILTDKMTLCILTDNICVSSHTRFVYLHRQHYSLSILTG
jgi:hypothetical protein